MIALREEGLGQFSLLSGSGYTLTNFIPVAIVRETCGQLSPAVAKNST